MQSMEKIAWKSDGARHAHVEAQDPVPRVMPAASRAPTLRSTSALYSTNDATKNALVEVIQEPDSPGSIATCERLTEVHTARNAGDDVPKPQDDTGDDEPEIVEDSQFVFHINVIPKGVCTLQCLALRSGE